MSIQNQAQPQGGNADRKSMADKLREAREYLGFSQDEVAKFLGIARSALSNIETGQRKVEAMELARLAQLYKRPVSHFTGEEEPNFGEDVNHLARTASELSPPDREELHRFAEYLRARKQTKGA